MRVGVVVPCKNEGATIRQCLTSLRSQVPAPERVVVVDNGSTDGSLQIARELADEVLEVAEGRIGQLRNQGARALGEVDAIGFVDADCEVGPGWLAAAAKALETADLVGSRSSAPADANWVASGWADLEERTVHSGSALWTTTLAIRSDTFTELGGFDADLATGEDSDLSRRTADSGGRLEFVPEMTSVHHGFPKTVSGYLRRERWHTGTPGWFRRMSGRSRSLVLLAAGWLAVGAVSTGVTAGTRSAGPIAAWAGLTALGVPVLGGVVGRSARHAVRDGVLLGLWAGVRVSRLPREVVHETSHLRRSR